MIPNLGLARSKKHAFQRVLKFAAMHRNFSLLASSLLMMTAWLSGHAGAIASGDVVTVAKPAIVSREEWGSKPQPIADNRKQVPVWVTIHHAGEVWHDKDDPIQFVRHMQVWGQNRPKLEKPPRDTYWPDLPYHFLIAPDGRIFEGRPTEYEPESNTKYPLSGNIGVEMMGDFNLQRPTLKQIQSCVRLTAWLCQQYHIDLEHVRTHQDAAPDQTDCPGKDFYRYIADGQFKHWVAETMQGKEPEIDPGPSSISPKDAGTDSKP
jgi:hypothetical protein